MSDHIRIPFLIWGGNKNLDIEINNKNLKREEIDIYVDWSKKWGDKPRFGEYIENGGISWLNLPLPASKYRLHLRPFFVRRGNERPSFYFVGFFFTEKDISSFTDFFSLIDAIQSKDLNEILNLKSDMVAIGVKGKDKTDAQVDNGAVERLTGQVFKGTYLKLKENLNEYLTTKVLEPFDEIAIACNPPDEYEGLTTLLITDDFYYQGLKIIPISGEKPPEKKKPSNPKSPITEPKASSTKVLVAILTGLILAGSIYNNYRLSQEVKMKESEVAKMSQILAASDKLKNECKNELNKCSAAVSLRKGDAKKKRMLKM